MLRPCSLRSRRVTLGIVLAMLVSPLAAFHAPVPLRAHRQQSQWRVPYPPQLAGKRDTAEKAAGAPGAFSIAAASKGVVTPTTVAAAAAPSSTISPDEYTRGLLTVGFITLLFASNSPALRAAFTSVEHVPPPLLVSAVASITALSSLLIGGPLLSSVPTPSTLEADATDAIDAVSLRAGAELGLWKCVGTSLNLYGLSLTSADHGAFLIQLTTLIVPVVQGVQGVPIPRRIWIAVVVALGGLLVFTTDPSGAADGASSLTGDLCCVAAAVCYALYDLRLFVWGKRVTPLRLIQNKVAAQALVALGTLLVFGSREAAAFFSGATPDELQTVVPLVLWSGIVVNGVAPFLQVGGQQAVGPARAQVIYASGPLWAALISLVTLGETVGAQGVAGGGAFLVAVLLAASTPAPDPDCDENVCEA